MPSIQSSIAESRGSSNHGPALSAGERRFTFATDTFAFANELIWEYRFDTPSSRPQFLPRVPRPDYAHRCFVLVRAARQFLYHATFLPDRPALDEASETHAIRQVMALSPRRPSRNGEQVVIPGHSGLREFSHRRESILKRSCGGAWQSYALRSHWRMVFPISRAHQEATSTALRERIQRDGTAVVHLVRFPALTINHGMLLFGVEPAPQGLKFSAYDPNQPELPAHLDYDAGRRAFSLEANRYWAGGELKVIEIFKGWLY